MSRHYPPEPATTTPEEIGPCMCGCHIPEFASGPCFACAEGCLTLDDTSPSARGGKVCVDGTVYRYQEPFDREAEDAAREEAQEHRDIMRQLDGRWEK